MNRFLLAIGVLFGFLLLQSSSLITHGQTAREPILFVTWRPQVYVPADFRGRILPTAGSKIYASVDLFDGGRMINLSGQRIYWYVNDVFVDDGANKQTINFIAPQETGTGLDLRVQLPDYKGGILKTVTIPLVAPRAIIEAPFPGNIFSNTDLNFRALPYFFNVSNLGQLVFSWTANGASPDTNENPQSLHVDLNGEAQPGFHLDLRLLVKNPRATFSESGGDGVSLLFNQ